MMIIMFIGVLACVVIPNNNADKPIIAFEDIIYKEFRDKYLHKHQQWSEIQQIDRWYTKIEQVISQQTTGLYITKKRKVGKYYWLLSWNLFKTYLKNDHTVVSVFQRSDGTNFSTKQRIALFLLYMYCIMMADAIFYGNQNERKLLGDLTASALISLIGTIPVYIIRIL
eukprot:207600_1